METGWLIQGPYRADGPTYFGPITTEQRWHGRGIPGFGWTLKYQIATRFSRKEDAQRILDGINCGNVCPEAKVCEYQ
jgi:hypothetical protein